VRAQRQGEPRVGSTLGFLSLLLLGINGIVGVGIFLVPSRLAELVPGTPGIAVYAVTALLLTPVAIVYATLGGRFSEDGGPYVWARAAFGSTVGFFVGFMMWVSALLSLSAVLLGFSLYAGAQLGLHGELERKLFGAGSLVVLGAIAASGLRLSALVWNSITLLKLVPLVLLIGLSVWFAAPAQAAPSKPIGVGELWRGALLLVFAFQGFEMVSVPAGHARGRWTIPVATVLSLAVAAVLYLFLHAACVRALPDLARSDSPLVEAGAVYGGARVAWIMAVGTNVSALGIAFGMFAMTPRYLAVLGTADGLGAWLGQEDARGVPRRALWISAGFVLLPLLAGGVSELFVLSSVAVLTQYAVSAAALVVLASRRQNELKPSQLWPAPLALGAVVLVGWAARASELLVAAGVLVLGAVLLLLRRALAGSGRRR
jgi:basic amino acid/polyamine antiporter, APA family